MSVYRTDWQCSHYKKYIYPPRSRPLFIAFHGTGLSPPACALACWNSIAVPPLAAPYLDAYWMAAQQRLVGPHLPGLQGDGLLLHAFLSHCTAPKCGSASSACGLHFLSASGAWSCSAVMLLLASPAPCWISLGWSIVCWISVTTCQASLISLSISLLRCPMSNTSDTIVANDREKNADTALSENTFLLK